MQVDVWSDVVCPWCYIGKRRLEGALAQIEGGEAIQVVWHSFQLDPSAPARSSTPTIDHLCKKYGLTPEKAREMMAHVSGVAAKEGLDFKLESGRFENTRTAHRLLQLALERGVQSALKERLMKAYFEQAQSIGDPANLRALAVEVGLAGEEVDRVLSDAGAYGAGVDADIAAARRYGIRGVPFFVIDGRLGVSGAQPVEVLLGALREARGVELGAVCDDQGCELD